ncbi:MAG TPA: metal ABC transporter substrate-binding protein [Symbiobacteriaceae bacterium]|nr:metal ABC transporter substrate-binding protein [Symbiobacteriaceae bacterium]
MRRTFVSVSLLLVFALLAGCSRSGGGVPAFSSQGGKLKVAASFWPVYEFARQVGGDRIDLVNMVPVGTEPHEWEPTPRHLKTLNEASLFIYSGAGMESWVEKTLESLDNKSLVVVEASHGIDLIEAGAEEEGHGHGHDEEMDPHVWLDPLGAVHQVEAIRDGLIQADAAGRAVYEANAAAYIERLKALDADFSTGLAACSNKTFYTTHAAFGYLAHRYGLEQHPIMGLAPDAEPKPKDLEQIVAQAKKDNVTYIFFETLVSDKVAKLVAGEIGAQTLVLNPLEGLTDAEVKAGKDYLSVMRDNLANLRLAMECDK